MGVGKDRRQAAYRKGRRAEALAAFILRCKGYRILESGKRGRRGTSIGEIDLIAQRGRLVVFVEVKARSDLKNARAAISQRQRERIRSAAEQYLGRQMARHSDRRAGASFSKGLQGRFDAILVAPGPFGLPLVKHIQNAWS